VTNAAMPTPTQNAVWFSPCHDFGQWLANNKIKMSTRNTAVTRGHDKANPNLR
jgi:hypothetical protein